LDLTDVSPELPLERPRFQADGGSRLGPTGPEVLLAFEAPYAELFFRPSGSRFRSRFDLILILLDGKRQVGGDLFSETIDVLDRRDTRDPAARVRRVLPVRAKPGNYAAEVILRETAAGRQARVAWKIEVPDYASLPLSISSLWVSDPTAANADSALLPPAGWVLRHRFGEPLGPLVVSGEVYRHDGGSDAVRLVWRILGSRGDEVQSGEMVLPMGERVRHADEQFSVLGPGWRSDRGRVYIQFGPPDQVENRSMNLDMPAYEVWTYLREGRRFVFVDYEGFGRYELYRPGQ
jgi:GWxTD domain-containing protein